jgi:AraC-like DNA-binding protein
MLKEVLLPLFETHIAAFIPASDTTVGHPAVDRAIRFISEHCFEEIGLNDIAAAAGLSRYYLIRIFQAETGITPHVFLTQTRLEHARDLLRAGSALADTASRCGFVDQSHFTHRFRQFYGYTPGIYARACQPA